MASEIEFVCDFCGEEVDVKVDDGKIEVVPCGNCYDLQKSVTIKMVAECVEQGMAANGMYARETSLLINQKVNDAFDMMDEMSAGEFQEYNAGHEDPVLPDDSF